MANLLLTRTDTSDQGTFGKLTDEAGEDVAVTCERPDNGNQRMGCIPVGKYHVTQFNSPSKGKDFIVLGVQNRSMIEIHKGNTIKDTEGCILVGLLYGHIGGVKAVLSSTAALAKMLAAYPDGFNLQIVEEYTS